MANSYKPYTVLEKGSVFQLILSAPLANSYKGRVYICGECFAKTTTR